jgi:hypothetical protein
MVWAGIGFLGCTAVFLTLAARAFRLMPERPDDA